MKVLIRADASERLGGGHLGRCIALAERLNESGHKVEFAVKAGEPLASSMLRPREFKFHELECGPDWQSDAAATADICGTADWIVVDHYGLDAKWQHTLKAIGKKILAIDDLADRPHCSDILVDAGRSAEDDAYQKLVPDSCEILLGPNFLILRREFVGDATAVSASSHTRVLVFFGAADGANLTVPTLDALDRMRDRNTLDVHVLLTDANPRCAEIRSRNKITIHENVRDMAALMSEMDVAIGAGGVSMWERCRMGLPSLTVAVNDNQKTGMEIAGKRGAIVALSLSRASVQNELDREVARFLQSPDKLAEISAAGPKIVDGNGSARIVALMGSANLRLANDNDVELIWNWANDPDVRRMSFHSDPIPYADHVNWYAARMGRDDVLMLIAHLDNEPAGQIRFDYDQGEAGWLVDISVDPKYRGRGHALEFLIKAVRQLHRARPKADAIAWVKTENRPSIRLFETAGFVRSGEKSGAVRFVCPATEEV